MSNVSIVDQLREMRLTAMAREFEAQSQDPATYSQIPFEERFGLIVNAGWNSQQASKLRRRIHDAHFDIPSACMEGIEYFEDRKLNREELTRLSTCKYIDEKHHIVLKGATGSGKTYIACALGNRSLCAYARAAGRINARPRGKRFQESCQGIRESRFADYGRVADETAHHSAVLRFV